MLKVFTNDLKLLTRYKQLLPLCFAVFVSMLGFGLVMPLLPIYARNFGATGLQLGFLTSSFAITRAVTTYPGGWLADKKGRKTPITAGLLAYSVVMALYGFSQEINQLIFLRALQGIASGIVWPVISTMVADVTSPEDRGKAMGFYEMMWYMGMVIGPAVGGVLADAFTVAVPFFFCGTLAFLSMLLVVFTVKETSAITTQKAKLKEEVTYRFNEKTPKMTLHPRIFIGLCAVGFVISFSHSLIQPILSVFANEELNISKTDVGLLFTAMGVVTLLTTLPLGTMADRVGRKLTLVLGILLDAASAFLIVVSGNVWLLLLAMMIRGLGRAAANPPLTAMFSNLVPTLKRGKGMGIFNGFRNVGLVVGSAAGGFLYEAASSETPFIICVLVGLIGVGIVLLMVSEPKEGLE